MKVTRTEWSQNEIDQLIFFTKPYRESNAEINWDIVSEQMRRTRSQCKSYYQIVLKKQLNLEQRKNHMWAASEVMGLWTAMQTHNEDYSAVQKQFFPSFTLKQLRGQYMSMSKRHTQYMHDFTSILQNPSHIQQIPDKLFISECFVIKIGCRHEINEGVYDPKSGKLPDYQKEVNETAFKSFWRNINPLDLRVVYVIEQQRRRISESEIDAVKTI
ncbi:Conserved_hypothetical protein [Hexamita inflata]|uniref:Myb-like DNA-binding domain-containing protein n=1 Tax=Hexamita inflata TaxID=28002 RepID=A0AA86NCN7_9EUKA|nr:Conserved hypothetical protein [Hexamita inflata]